MILNVGDPLYVTHIDSFNKRLEVVQLTITKITPKLIHFGKTIPALGYTSRIECDKVGVKVFTSQKDALTAFIARKMARNDMLRVEIGDNNKLIDDAQAMRGKL